MRNVKQLVLVTLLVAVLAGAGPRPAAGQGADAAALGRRQSQVGERMSQVEQRLLELARFVEDTEPERAGQLRRALALSREGFVVARMAEVGHLLAAERYAEAASVERQVLQDLERVAAALSAQAWAAELARLRRAEGELSELVRRQTGALEAASRLLERLGMQAASAEDAAAATDQEAIRQAAEKLLAELGGGPGSDALGRGVRSMSAAQAALNAAARAGAVAEEASAAQQLQAALSAVRQAMADLSAARRAEVRARLIEVLAAVLSGQEGVRAETERMQESVSGVQAVSRAARLALAGLAARQEALMQGLDQALELAASDPAAVALPVLLRAARQDVAACADLLRSGVTGAAVQDVQREIEAEIRAAIEALRGQEGAPPVPPAPAGQPPQARGARPAAEAVDAGTELKLLRAMQASTQRRTAALDARRNARGELPPSSAGALEALSVRQAEVTTTLGALDEALGNRRTQ